MLEMFARFRREVRLVKPSSFRPALEKLEDRDCPSTISLHVDSYAANKQVTLSGDLIATAPLDNLMGGTSGSAPSTAGMPISLSGAVSGTATTDINGHFSVTLTATALDTVFATTTDPQFGTAQVLLMDAAPQITFGVVSYSYNMYLFKGMLNGTAQGALVTLGGMVVDTDGKVLTVNSNGYFSLVIQLTGPDDTGSVTAQATDWWGLTSNLADTWISQTAAAPTTDPSSLVGTIQIV